MVGQCLHMQQLRWQAGNGQKQENVSSAFMALAQTAGTEGNVKKN